MDKNIGIFERISSAYYQLTAAERKVADYVLEQGSQVQFMSITQLAEECGTAEATISRFCRTLKLKGFNAFKIEIAQYCASNGTSPEFTNGDVLEDSFEGRCQNIGWMIHEAVTQTLQLAVAEDVNQAVHLLEQAERIVSMGAGTSMLPATEFAQLFSRVSNKFVAISDSHQQMATVANMTPRDVLVIFSYSGATHIGLELLSFAKDKEIPTILVTRFLKSPASKIASVVLRCGSNESPHQTGSIPAHIAQLVVMDVLFREYFSRNQEICEQRMQRIATALSTKHL